MSKVYAVCFGGASSEYEISCVSASWVIDCIKTEDTEVLKIGISKDGVWFLYNGPTEKIRNLSWIDDKENLVPCVISPCTVQHGIFVFNKAEGTFESKRIDAVFPVLHGKNGEDGTIQGLFELARIPYVGCSTYSSAVCMDKITAKLICTGAGIKNAKMTYVRSGADYDAEALKREAEKIGYPLFVKPSNTGSSIGVSKVKSSDELVKAVENAFKFDRKVLVEEYIEGREIEVAVFSDRERLIVSECGEVVPDAEFYDFEAKYVSGGSKTFIPANLCDDVAENVRAAAKQVFELLDCKGLSRVDFFVKKDGEIYFNEINTIPGFTEISLYPSLMRHLGIDGEELVEMLFESASLGGACL